MKTGSKGSAATATFRAKELAKFDVGKGTIRFQPENPLPVALLKRLIRSRVERLSAALPSATETARRLPTAARR